MKTVLDRSFPSAQRELRPQPGMRLLRCLLLVGLLAAMLFAHGCHPSEDNELFTGMLAWVFG